MGLKAAVTKGLEMFPAQASAKGQLCSGAGSVEQRWLPSHAQRRGAARPDSGWSVPAVPVLPISWPGGASYQGERWRGSEFPGSAGVLKGRLSPPGAAGRDTRTGPGTIAVTRVWAHKPKVHGAPAPRLYPGTATQPCAPPRQPPPCTMPGSPGWTLESVPQPVLTLLPRVTALLSAQTNLPQQPGEPAKL